MNCPQCQKEEAVQNSEYGILPGEDCQRENSRLPKPTQGKTFDFASPKTKADRLEYGSEMYQPWVNGVLSKEFIEVNGTEKLAGVTKEDIKNAKYVYKSHVRHHRTSQNGKMGLNRNPKLKANDYKVVEK